MGVVDVADRECAVKFPLARRRDAKRLTTIHLPVTFPDGGIGWLEMRYCPTATERLWAMHDAEYMREAYAVLAVTKARSADEHVTDLKVGWTSEEGN